MENFFFHLHKTKHTKRPKMDGLKSNLKSSAETRPLYKTLIKID